MRRRSVIFGFLGTTLDVGLADRRWRRWRPSVSLGALPDFPTHRVELFHPPGSKPLATQVAADMGQLANEWDRKAPDVVLRPLELADPWDFEEVFGALYDFAQAYPFDTSLEDYYVHITTGTHVVQICLFLLCETKIIPAKLLQTMPLGTKSIEGRAQIIDLDLSRYDRLAARFAKTAAAASADLKLGIATTNRAFNALMAEVEAVASATRDPILLAGATGTGKTSLAGRIVKLKEARGLVKRGAPFIEVNCATITGDGAMSTLFGHVKGAFTGALADRIGLLELADGGVLFLDEVGELGLDEQAMLLRAIEDKTFRPVGGQKVRRSDFQLICGTNRPLRGEVEKGRFREDLLARIDLWEFRLPALRERKEDLEPNVLYELEAFERRTGHRIRFSAEAKQRFLAFAASPAALWRGNFRELGAALTRMATLALGEDKSITTAIVDRETERLARAWEARGSETHDGKASQPAVDRIAALIGTAKAEAMSLFDKLQLASVLEVCARSRSLAAAGRTLFGDESAANATDRVRKFLLRHGVDPRQAIG